MSLILTDDAAAKVRGLMERDAEQSLVLRIAVQPGGCSGLRYALYFDDAVADTDQVVEHGGVRVAVDKMSAPYLAGARIDYLDTLERSGFVVDNPNATGTCACGDSFR